MTGFAAIYNEIFETRQVETPDELDEVFRLRYQVYCLENPFEKAEENNHEREIDAYDVSSVHSLLIHRPSGMIIGSSRVILPKKNDWQNSFPMQQVCNIPKFQSRDVVLSSCEASRFCISKTRRSRVEDCSQYTAVYEVSDINNVDDNTKRSIPYTSLGLIKSVASVAVMRDVPYVYAVMESKLIRFLVRLGVEFEPVGEKIEYHGTRIPSVYSPLQLYENTFKNHPETWKVLTENGYFHEMALEKSRKVS